MGVIKTIGYAAFGLAIFYGGMVYERGKADEHIAELNDQLKQQDTIEFKVQSLIEARAKNPERVDEVLENFAGGGQHE